MNYISNNTVLCESEESATHIANNELSRFVLKLLMKSVQAQEITKEKKCKECGGLVEFVVTESSTFDKIGLLPAHCSSCRRKHCEIHEKEKIEMKWQNDKERCCGLQNRYINHLGERPFLTEVSEDFPYQEIFINKIKGIVNNETNIGAIIFGNTGTGKTYLTKILNNELCDKTRNTCYIKAVEMAMVLRQAAFDRNTNYKTVLSQFQTIETLIIDDYGTQKNTEWVKECIFMILDYRYENRKTTIITTNCDLEELKELEPRLYSRLSDMDWVKKIYFKAKDYRLKQTNIYD